MKKNDTLNNLFLFIKNNSFKRKTIEKFAKKWKKTDDVLVAISSSQEEEFKFLTLDKDLFPFDEIKKNVNNKENLIAFWEMAGAKEKIKFLALKGEKEGEILIIASKNHIHPHFFQIIVMNSLIALSNTAQ